MKRIGQCSAFSHVAHVQIVNTGCLVERTNEVDVVGCLGDATNAVAVEPPPVEVYVEQRTVSRSFAAIAIRTCRLFQLWATRASTCRNALVLRLHN